MGILLDMGVRLLVRHRRFSNADLCSVEDDEARDEAMTGKVDTKEQIQMGLTAKQRRYCIEHGLQEERDIHIKWMPIRRRYTLKPWNNEASKI